VETANPNFDSGGAADVPQNRGARRYRTIVTELRAALEEHVRLAKDSLAGQLDNFALLSDVAHKSSWKE
jgi:hypothetical protein